MMMKTTITYGNNANKEIKEKIYFSQRKANTQSHSTYVVCGDADENDGKR